jgi:DNA-binding beta-propeller fold protein YncE
MNFKLFSKAFLALAILLSFTRCEKDETTPLQGKFSKGIFIVNEGNYTKGNASISFYDRDSLKVTNDLFHKINNRPLGDIGQSMTEHNDKYYIVVNNSSKIEIVNKTDFVSTGVIEGLAQPRYFLGIDNQKAYVSQWGANGLDGSLAIIDLSDNSVTKTIPIGSGTEKMVALGDSIYVANSGGFGNDSTIAVVNSITDELVTHIKVGYNPAAIVTDKNNKLWVLCGGKWKSDYSGLEKPGALVKVNPSNNQVELTLNFTSMSGGYDRKSLSINEAKDVLYYTLDGNLYEQNITSTALSIQPKITREFYNVSVDPSTGMFYGADIRYGTTNGWIIRYSPSYAIVDSFEVGILPDEMFFN